MKSVSGTPPLTPNETGCAPSQSAPNRHTRSNFMSSGDESKRSAVTECGRSSARNHTASEDITANHSSGLG